MSAKEIEQRMQEIALREAARCEQKLLKLESEICKVRAPAFLEAYQPWTYAQTTLLGLAYKQEDALRKLRCAKDGLAGLKPGIFALVCTPAEYTDAAESAKRAEQFLEGLPLAIEVAARAHAEAQETLLGPDEALRRAVRQVVDLCEREEAWRFVAAHCGGYVAVVVAPEEGGRVAAAHPLRTHANRLVWVLAEQALREARCPGQAPAGSSHAAGAVEPGSGRVRSIVRLAVEREGDLLTMGEGRNSLEARQLLAIMLCRESKLH